MRRISNCSRCAADQGGCLSPAAVDRQGLGVFGGFPLENPNRNVVLPKAFVQLSSKHCDRQAQQTWLLKPEQNF